MVVKRRKNVYSLFIVDVAIAAPLEVGQRDDGTYYTGVVYIFRGDSVTSISTVYSQVRTIWCSLDVVEGG